MADKGVSIRLSLKDGELVRAALQKLGADGEAALKKIDRAAAQAAQGPAALKTAFDKLGPAISVAVGAFSTGALVALAKNSLEAAGGIGELAEQLGITAQAYQALQFAAAQGGVGTDQLDKAIANLSRTIGDAARGSDQAVKTFRALGVNVLDAAGKIRPTNDVLGDIADKLASIGDANLRASLAADVFGKSGQKLLTILTAGRGALEQYAIAAKKAGDVLSDSEIAAADKAADAIKRIGLAWDKTLQHLAAEIAPGVESFATGVEKNFRAVADAVEVLGTALAGLLAARGALLAISALANPFVAAGAAIAGTVAALYAFRDTTIEIGDKTATVGEIVSVVWEDIKGLWHDFVQFLKDGIAWLDNIAATLVSFKSQIGDQLTSTWHSTVDFIGVGLNTLWQNFKTVFENIGRLSKAAFLDIATNLSQMALNPGAFAARVLTGQSRLDGNLAQALGGIQFQSFDAALAARRQQRLDLEVANDVGGGNAGNSQSLSAAVAGLLSGFGAPGTYANSVVSSADAARRQLQRDLGEFGEVLPGGPAFTPASGKGSIPATTSELEKMKSQADEAAKALAAIQAQASFGARIAEAASQGQAAVDRLKIEADATTLAIKKFGPETDANRDAFEKFKKSVIDARLAQAAADFTASWRLATQDIERNNTLLARQIELVGAPIDIRAHEIALLRVRNQLEAEGKLIAGELVGIEQKDVDARVAALEQQEKLNDALRRTQEEQQRWLEPFKQAIQSLQGIFENVFAQILDGGVKNFKDLGKQVLAIFKQLAVQIATLLVFRPVVSGVLNYAGLGGLAQQLGFSGGTSTGAGGVLGALGGAGGSPVAGTGNLGGGGLFGSVGGNSGIGAFLARPVTSLFGDSVPTGAAAQALGAGGGFFDNLSIGGALGALGGGLGGILQLTQGNYIGGITSLIGAGVSLIPGIGQIAGPIISILGPLLGSLFSKKPPHANAQLLTAPLGTLTDGPNTPFQGRDFTYTNQFGILGYAGAGTNSRFDDPEGAAGDFLKAVNEIDKALAAMLSASQIATVAHALQTTPALKTDFKKFDNEGFDIVKDRLQTEFKALFGSNVANTAFEGIQRGNDHIQELAQRASDVVAFSKALDQLGKSTTDAETAVKAINDQFDQLKGQATQYGFGQDTLDKIAAQRQTAIDQLAKDFNAQTARNALAITDPNQLALNDLLADQEKRRQNALYLNTVSTTLIDINALEAEFGLERQNLVKQQLGNLTQSFRDFFDQLLLGPQSALSPQKQLEQALGRYHDVTAALTASNDNDPVARAAFQQAASNALALERMVNASSAETAALFAEIVAITRRLGDIPGFATGGQAQGLFLAGEQGPELIYSAQRVNVMNNSATRAALGDRRGGITAQDMRSIMADVVRAIVATFESGHGDVAGGLRALAATLADRNQQNRVAMAAQNAGRRRVA